jgi:hypothetical protein
MIVSEQNVQFSIESIVLVADTVAGRFPKWQSVIPQTNGVEPAIVKCETLSTAFERAKNATVPHDYKENFLKGIRLFLEPGKFTLRVGKSESVKMETSISVTYNGESARMYIDPKNLTGLLKALDKDVKLSIYPGRNAEYPTHNSEEPVTITVDDGFTFIVMPLLDDDRTPEEQAAYEVEKEQKQEAERKAADGRQQTAADDGAWEDESDEETAAEEDVDEHDEESECEDEAADSRWQTESVNDQAVTEIPVLPNVGKAVTVLRESGEKVSGLIVPGKAKKGFLTFADPFGTTYNIPARCCTWTKMGQIAYIVLTDDELTMDTSLQGIFTSGFAV